MPEVVEGKFRKKSLDAILDFIASAAGAIWIFISGNWKRGAVKIKGDRVYVDGKDEGGIDDIGDVRENEP